MSEMSGKRVFSLMRLIMVSAALTFIFAGAANAQVPGFTKVFSPDTIGPGSVSTLTFTIDNTGSGTPVTGLAFTDNLPAGMTIVNQGSAPPSAAETDCTDGTISAPHGGATIGFSGARLGALSSCTVTVNVTSSTTGTNTTGALTSSAGNSGTATDTLTVSATLPGFSKSFSPGTIARGGRSTLTFTIDNTANASDVLNLDFTDSLPAGMEIADPPVATTTCGTAPLPPVITADAGTDVITLNADGVFGFPSVAAAATCTVTVDVIGTANGTLGNLSGDLLADFVVAGKAFDALDVTVTSLALQKSFADDPAPPGSTVELDFVIDNYDRNFAATGIAFTDDLTTALAGLIFSSLLSNDCGGSVSGTGTTTITFSGGTLPAEGSCTIRTSLTVPAVIPGAYVNTTGTVTGTVDGSPVVGNTASETLFVSPVPVLTKEFLESGTLLPNPIVDSGDDVVLRFTVTNTSTTSSATDITFLDELTDGSGGVPPDLTSGFLPFPVTVTLPPVPDPPCGAGSALSLVSVNTDRVGLQLTGGSLTVGSTCSFDVTLTIPAGFAPGTYTNTTEVITATVDGATRTGPPASDDITVIAAPQLSKAFTDDPVAPGGTVTLEFTLTYPDDAGGDATGVTFTDNLGAALAGLAAAAGELPLSGLCTAGNGTLAGTVGDTLLTFSGATLSAGEVCTFSLTLDVPAGAAAGSYTNTTSDVSASVGGEAATAPSASDDLSVQGLTFTKEFLGDPVIAGDTVPLRFTIANVHPTDDATITFFTDNLAGALSGLAATGGPLVNTCGGALSGTTFLIYTGGSVLSGQTCTIEVDVLVPPGAADGTYINTTSFLSANQGGAVVIDPATDSLTVTSSLLSLSKAFTDDPVIPGSTVTLEFTLLNLDAGRPASAVGFTDDLALILPGATDLTFASVLFNDCGATVTGTGTSLITVTGGALGAGGSCTIRTSLTVPGGAAPNTYTNTTSGVTGDIGGFAVGGPPASDNLEVVDLLLLFSKTFDGLSTATGNPVLTYTITNPGTNAAADISFTDNLDSVIPGLAATNVALDSPPCGAASSLAGTSLLAFTGGELAPMGGTCSFRAELLVPVTATAGIFTSTTSDLTRFGIKVADPATAGLTIEPAPAFSKAFAPASIGGGEISTLTFAIDNAASALPASLLAFTDPLPAGVTVASPSGATSTCGGTLTAVAGSGDITLSGGTVANGATCTVAVDVTGTNPGAYVNTTGGLTSSSGSSGSASDTLTVTSRVAGDWNGDGYTDMLWLNPDDGSNMVTYMDDRTQLGIGTLKKAPPPWTFGAANDFNRDGLMDIAWRNPDTGQTVAAFYDDTIFLGLKQLPAVPLPWVLCGSGDFNHDDNADLVWCNPITEVNGVQLLQGTKQVGVRVLPPLAPGWQVGAVGDFDNDGDSDLMIRRAADGTSAIMYLDGTKEQSMSQLPSTRSATICGSMDLDGDGNTDLLGRLPASGINGVWYLENGVRLGVGKLKNTLPPPWQCMTGVR